MKSSLLSIIGILSILMPTGVAFADDITVSDWHDGWVLSRDYLFDDARNAQSVEVQGGGNFSGEQDVDGAAIFATCAYYSDHYDLQRGYLAMNVDVPEGQEVVSAELYIKPMEMYGNGWSVEFAKATSNIQQNNFVQLSEFGNLNLGSPGYFSGTASSNLTADSYTSFQASNTAIADMNANHFIQIAVGTSNDANDEACDSGMTGVKFYSWGADPGVSEPYLVIHTQPI